MKIELVKQQDVDSIESIIQDIEKEKEEILLLKDCIKRGFTFNTIKQVFDEAFLDEYYDRLYKIIESERESKK